MNRSALVCTVFVVLIISFSPSNGIIYHDESDLFITGNNEHQMAPADSYTPHGPINITDNANFSIQGWSGSGIVGDPYIIEGLEITADGVCISITDTTVYFEVKDCRISSVYVSTYDGIVLDNVTHGTVRNCIIDKHSEGIILNNCNSCILRKNNASSNTRGMYLEGSSSCTLIHNIVYSNQDDGFRLYYSDKCVLTNNTVSECNTGFDLYESDNCTLTNNTASNNSGIGFYLVSSSGSTLTHNAASSNSGIGIHLVGFCSSTLTNNTASNNSVYGFYLGGLRSCILTNNTSSSNIDGFILHILDNCTLTYNTASSNSNDGFRLTSSFNCTFTHNTAFSNSKYGIYLTLWCEDNLLYLNRLGNNGDSNACDDGVTNSWDDGISQGNYWMDYNGNGTYPILGDADSVDHYPFLWVPETSTTTGYADSAMLILVLFGVGIAGMVIIIVVILIKRNGQESSPQSKADQLSSRVGTVRG